LSQNFPNPFNPITEIHFSLDRDEEVQLCIYDISGGLVRTIAHRKMTLGAYVEKWDGRDRFGKEVASGVYFYRLKAGKKVLTRKMVLLR
jgi:flagellar hook assembly protein FlgD